MREGRVKGEIADITPKHEPIAVARQMVERAPRAKAALAVLVGEDGSIWFDSAGHERAYVLWGLQKMIFKLMDAP